MSRLAPVIIAGAGPVGSVLALYLAQHKVPVILLEKGAELAVDLRASTFHPPTLEMLAQLGLIEEMLEQGLKVERYQYWDRQTMQVAEFDMSLIADETDFPFRLQLEQYELTRIINKKLATYSNAEVLFSHEVLGFEMKPDGVCVDIQTPFGCKHLDASFLVACDGAHSNIRRKAGIDYAGFTYDEKFLVASTDFPFEKVFENLSYVNYIADPDEWCVILRTEKLWRVLWPCFVSEDQEKEILTDEYIQKKLQKIHEKDGDYTLGHKTLYKVHQRVAETYVKDRVILAGDACHINNPLGGMGMNGGIHDAYNLAGKLVDIYLHGKDANLQLQRYDKQRRELAVKFVQEHTIKNKQLMEETGRAQQLERQRWLMETAADPVKAKAFMMERSMINCLRESLTLA